MPTAQELVPPAMVRCLEEHVRDVQRRTIPLPVSYVSLIVKPPPLPNERAETEWYNDQIRRGLAVNDLVDCVTRRVVPQMSSRTAEDIKEMLVRAQVNVEITDNPMFRWHPESLGIALAEWWDMDLAPRSAFRNRAVYPT